MISLLLIFTFILGTAGGLFNSVLLIRTCAFSLCGLSLVFNSDSVWFLMVISFTLLAVGHSDLMLVFLGFVGSISLLNSTNLVMWVICMEVLTLVSVGLLSSWIDIAWHYMVIGWFGTVLFISGILSVYLETGDCYLTADLSDVSLIFLIGGLVVKMGIGPAVGIWVSMTELVSTRYMLIVDCGFKTVLLYTLFTISVISDYASRLTVIAGTASCIVGGFGLSFAGERAIIAYSGCIQIGLALVSSSLVSWGEIEPYVIVYIISCALWWTILGIGSSGLPVLLVTLLISMFGLPGFSGFAVKYSVYSDIVNNLGSTWSIVLMVGIMFAGAGYTRSVVSLVRGTRVEAERFSAIGIVFGLGFMFVISAWILSPAVKLI